LIVDVLLLHDLLVFDPIALAFLEDLLHLREPLRRIIVVLTRRHLLMKCRLSSHRLVLLRKLGLAVVDLSQGAVSPIAAIVRQRTPWPVPLECPLSKLSHWSHHLVAREWSFCAVVFIIHQRCRVIITQDISSVHEGASSFLVEVFIPLSQDQVEAIRAVLELGLRFLERAH